MSTVSFDVSNFSREEVLKLPVIRHVVALATKVQQYVSDVFYIFCYFACPWMRSQPYEIYGRYKELSVNGTSEYGDKWWYGIECGNEAFICPPGKKLDGDKIAYWYEKQVSYADKARPYVIKLEFRKGEIIDDSEFIKSLVYTSRGKKPELEILDQPVFDN